MVYVELARQWYITQLLKSFTTRPLARCLLPISTFQLIAVFCPLFQKLKNRLKMDEKLGHIRHYFFATFLLFLRTY
jgi:hypothetical protein